MMRAPGAFLIVLGLFAASPASSAQQLYRWIDPQGRVHYSEQAPPPGASSVEKKRLLSSVVESPVPFAIQQAARDYPVVLYTSASCKEGCAETRQLLESRGVPFREVAVADLASVEDLRAVTGDNKVPALTIGKDVARAFDADSINAALDAAGYPAAPLVPARSAATPRRQP